MSESKERYIVAKGQYAAEGSRPDLITDWLDPIHVNTDTSFGQRITNEQWLHCEKRRWAAKGVRCLIVVTTNKPIEGYMALAWPGAFKEWAMAGEEVVE